MARRDETFEPGGRLLLWLTGLLAAGILLDVAIFASDWSQKGLLNRYEAAERRYSSPAFRDVSGEELEAGIQEVDAHYAVLAKEGEVNDLRQQKLGYLSITLFVVTAIFFLRALSRANRNARAMGADGMQFTPGWCIGWFFVPFANLFKPFQAVRETWRASIVTSGHWEDNPSAPILGFWWFLWIVSGILGQLLFRLSLGAKTIPELQNVTSLSLISGVVDVLLGITALVMIRRLYSMQHEKYRLFGLSVTAPPTESSCGHCGEMVPALVGDCPMCGEPLSPSPGDPQSDAGSRW